MNLKKKLLAATCLVSLVGFASAANAQDFPMNDLSNFAFQSSTDVTVLYTAGNGGNNVVDTTAGTIVQQYTVIAKHKAGDRGYVSTESSNILETTDNVSYKGMTTAELITELSLDTESYLGANTSVLNTDTNLNTL